MEFRELQGKITKALWKYGQENGIRVGDDYVLVKLFEEVGSIAKAALIYKNMCERSKMLPKEEAKKLLSNEIADTIGLLISFAGQLEIDVESAVKEKWLSKYPEESLS